MPNAPLPLQLYKIGALKFGRFTLKSGMVSPIYLDLRLIVSFPDLLKNVADAFWKKIASLSFDIICGVPYTALPIATALSLNHQIPMVMRRKEAKEHGTKKIIEGVYQEGQTCMVIEDLVTSGSSVIETIHPLQKEGIRVTDIAVLIDREQGGRQLLEKKGFCLHAVFTLSEILDFLHLQGLLDHETFHSAKTFILHNQAEGL